MLQTLWHANKNFNLPFCCILRAHKINIIPETRVWVPSFSYVINDFKTIISQSNCCCVLITRRYPLDVAKRRMQLAGTTQNRKKFRYKPTINFSDYVKYILHCRFHGYNRYSDISCKPLHIINYTKTISLPAPCGCGSFLVAHVVHCLVFLLIVVASKLWRQYTQKMVSGEVFTEGCQSTTWELCHKYLSCSGCTSSQDSFLQLLRPRALLSFTDIMYG